MDISNMVFVLHYLKQLLRRVEFGRLYSTFGAVKSSISTRRVCLLAFHLLGLTLALRSDNQ